MSANVDEMRHPSRLARCEDVPIGSVFAHYVCIMKNIVICCDGTGNEFGDQNSNVIKLYQVLLREPCRPCPLSRQPVFAPGTDRADISLGAGYCDRRTTLGRTPTPLAGEKEINERPIARRYAW